jgi:hypothetical protein
MISSVDLFEKSTLQIPLPILHGRSDWIFCSLAGCGVAEILYDDDCDISCNSVFCSLTVTQVLSEVTGSGLSNGDSSI